jgi:hypothetical protein
VHMGRAHTHLLADKCVVDPGRSTLINARYIHACIVDPW